MARVIWHSSMVLPENQQLPVIVRMAGWEQCNPAHSFGPYIRNYYLLHFVTKGKGVFKLHGQTYHLSAGDGFLIRPHDSAFYQADEADPWAYYWVGWDGEYAKNVVQDIKTALDMAVFHYGDIPAMTAEFEKLFTAYQEEYQPYKLLSCFYSLMNLLAEKHGKQNAYLSEAISFIKNNYAQNITIADIAACVSISPTHLNRLFKSGLNTSIKQYLIDYRLSRATRLLESSTLTLTEIADQCGFSHLAHFSAIYKKKTGKSPMEYRLENRKNYVN